MELEKIKKVYFIGIGGIGMSAMAQLLKGRGIDVSGSDLSETPVTKKLMENGIQVFLEQKAENISTDFDLVIYTIAIPEDNPELIKAKENNIPVKTYPEMLGVVSEDFYTIAISGTHGKTTTTAMTADALESLKPTVIVGSIISKYGSNFVKGSDKYFLLEACEYRRSFLNIKPNILAITNIEEDHLDYYKDLADIQDAFRNVALKVPEDGYIVCNPDNENIRPVLEGVSAKVVDYTKNPELTLKVPGLHNRQNAQVAFAIANILGVSAGEAEKNIGEFGGTWRRFEYKGKTKEGALVYDDYAHHPSEVKVTIQAFREKFPEKKIKVVFQPHLFSRTKSLLDDFAESLSLADLVVVTPIYAAREKDEYGVSHLDLGNKIPESRVVESVAGVEDVLDINQNDVIVSMGAGDIYKVGDMLILGE